MDKNGNVKRVLIILTNCFCHRRLDKAIISVDATVKGRLRNLQKVVKDPAPEQTSRRLWIFYETRGLARAIRM